MADEDRPRPGPVERGEALRLGQDVLRRRWALGHDDLAPLARASIGAPVLTIHDLNGMVLFHDAPLVGPSGEPVGAMRTSAVTAVGTPLVAAELSPRRWDPEVAVASAYTTVRERHSADPQGHDFVCYSYPKVGVRVRFRQDGRDSWEIVDAADHQPVQRFGPEAPPGQTVYSYYEEVLSSGLARRTARWEAEQADLALARTRRPELFELPGVELADRLADLRGDFDLSPDVAVPGDHLELSGERTIRFSPHCSPHECFELAGQQTSLYCAPAVGQMILDFYRWHYSQDEIATAMQTHPLGGTHITTEAEGYRALARGCLTAERDKAPSWRDATAEIDENRPFADNIPGHVRAVAGWARGWSPSAMKFTRSLKVYDPWPHNPDPCLGGTISWEDWEAVTHATFLYLRHRATPCP